MLVILLFFSLPAVLHSCCCKTGTCTYMQGGTRVRIYPFGSWFLPCGLRQHDCEQRLESRLKSDPGFLANSNVVGRHIYKGSWNGWNEWF